MSSKANNELRLWYELAGKLGYPVAVLQTIMPARELTYWAALWDIQAEEHEAAIAEAKAEAERQNPKKPPLRPHRGF